MKLQENPIRILALRKWNSRADKRKSYGDCLHDLLLQGIHPENHIPMMVLWPFWSQTRKIFKTSKGSSNTVQQEQQPPHDFLPVTGHFGRIRGFQVLWRNIADHVVEPSGVNSIDSSVQLNHMPKFWGGIRSANLEASSPFSTKSLYLQIILNEKRPTKTALLVVIGTNEHAICHKLPPLLLLNERLSMLTRLSKKF